MCRSLGNNDGDEPSAFELFFLFWITKTYCYGQSAVPKRSLYPIFLKEAAAGEGDATAVGLKRVLGVRDLTFFGIAAVIGTGGYLRLIGSASFHGGPAVILLFAFTAIACAFAAFCYAEFASTVPVSGSAYTYSYVAFGELFAWIIGWDLLMEYAIGNIAVAVSWSQYFCPCTGKAGLLIYLPGWPWILLQHAIMGIMPQSMPWQSGTTLSKLDIVTSARL